MLSDIMGLVVMFNKFKYIVIINFIDKFSIK